MNLPDIADTAAERISEVAYQEMADVRSELESITSDVADAIDTLEAYTDEPDDGVRIADALLILRGLVR